MTWKCRWGAQPPFSSGVPSLPISSHGHPGPQTEIRAQVAVQGVEGLPVRLAAQHYYATIIQESGAVAACFHDGVYRSKLGRSRLLEKIHPEMHRATFPAGRKKLF